MPGFFEFDALLTIPVEDIQMNLMVHGGQGGNVPGLKWETPLFRNSGKTAGQKAGTRTKSSNA